ncbi:MAG: hypothetical protein IT353_09010 [Gemmatimonadaceae bacterium]|nr:hypothetical protein [Gemmatimonadaceae bacterium]
MMSPAQRNVMRRVGCVIRCVRVAAATVGVLALSGAGWSCTNADDPVTPSSGPPSALPPTASVATTFELVGGVRLATEYASEGLALVTDADGMVVEVIGGAHVYSGSVHVYDLRSGIGSGAAVSAYPVMTPTRTWSVNTLFPRWIAGQNLRDVAVARTANGYELAGIGRVFYNTSPRAVTQVNVRELLSNGTVLGTAREIPVNLPEQEFTGFIKHDSSAKDFSAIGGGAYDSGQGSLGGLSYAIRDRLGQWTRRLNPPAFGDLTTPRLPRDTAYSCPDGIDWVCIPPVAGRGVWSTERMAGGGVRFGQTLMFIPTLGYGERRYSRQTNTFGDPAQDRAVAYFFRQATDSSAIEFVGYDRWTFAEPGEPVIGVALGRLRGVTGLLLFVVKANAWGDGAVRASPVLQVFRIK